MKFRSRAACVALLALAGAALAGDERAEIARARKELLDALGPAEAPVADVAGPATSAGTERLRLHDVELALAGPRGTPLGGVIVSALHETFDLTTPAAHTDARGRVTLRLPRGAWTVDAWRGDPADGRCVFARVHLDVVDPAAIQRVDLSETRTVRFRTRSGVARTPATVTLSDPTFAFHADVPPRGSAFEVFTAPASPIVVQATDFPDAGADGYVVRRALDPGTTTVETDPEGATRLSFRGANWRRVAPKLKSVDALPFEVEFDTDAKRDVLVAGLPSCAVSMSVVRRFAAYDFYALPLPMDGRERVFTGEPPFEVTAGYRHNTFSKYGKRKDSLSLRVFLRDANGLVLRGSKEGGPYEVAWKALLEGEAGAARTEYASGTMKTWYYARTPAIAARDIARLRCELTIRGPAEDRTVEVVPHAQTTDVVSGKVHLKSHPEFAPNAKLWADCIADGVRAWEDVCTTRRSRIDISLFGEMVPGYSGWGGVRGNTGYAYLVESSVMGFTGLTFYTGTSGHELGHAHGYQHGRAMQQASRRASRRYATLRPGRTRQPEGNRFWEILQAVTRGELRADVLADEDSEDADPHTGDDSDDESELDPDLDTTGEDDFLTWYLRSTHGTAVDRTRRGGSAAWSWALVLRGFSADEIQAACLSRAAGEPLAWLARLRGLAAGDGRVAEAVSAIGPGAQIPSSDARAAALSRWKKTPLAKSPDLAAARETLLSEIGDRDVRIAGLRAIAAQHLVRKEREAARSAFLRALTEARLASAEDFEETLAAAAAALAR